MSRYIIAFLILMLQTEIQAFEIKDYIWKIPLISGSSGVVISDDETRLIIIGQIEYSVYDLVGDSLITRIYFSEEGIQNNKFFAKFLTNNNIILFENSKFYIYDILKKEKSTFIDTEGRINYYQPPEISPDKNWFAFFGITNDIWSQSISLIDLSSRTITDSINFDFENITQPNDEIINYVFSMNSKSLLIMTKKGFMIEYNLFEKKIVNVFDIALKFDIPLEERNGSESNPIEVLSDSTILCNVYFKSAIFDYRTGEIIKNILPDNYNEICNVSNNKRYITGISDYSYFVYDLVTDSKIVSLLNQTISAKKTLFAISEKMSQFYITVNGLYIKYDIINKGDAGCFGIYGSKVKFSPDNDYLYYYGLGFSWKIDIQSGKIIEVKIQNTLEYNNKCTHLAFLSQLENGDEKKLLITNLKTNQTEFILNIDNKNIFFNYSKDDKYFVFADYLSKIIKVYETKNYAVIDSFYYEDLYSDCEINFSPDNNLISFVSSFGSDKYKLILRNIQEKEFVCEHEISKIFDFKYKFLTHDKVIGFETSNKYLTVFSPCKNTLSTISPESTKFIMDFYISDDNRYCIGSSFGYGNPSPAYTFIYDLEKSEFKDKLLNKTTQWSISNNNSYLALTYELPGYLYLYNFNKIVSSASAENESTLSTAMMVSPNPASNYIEISIPDLNKGLQPLVQKVQIFNTLGIEVGQSSLIVNPNNTNGQAGMINLLKIDISNLPTGVYFVKIGVKVVKFVKI